MTRVRYIIGTRIVHCKCFPQNSSTKVFCKSFNYRDAPRFFCLIIHQIESIFLWQNMKWQKSISFALIEYTYVHFSLQWLLGFPVTHLQPCKLGFPYPFLHKNNTWFVLYTLCESPEILTGKNRSPIFWYVVLLM